MNPTEKLMALQIDSLEIIERAYINFKKSPKERITLGYVQGRLEALENYFREFKCMHDKIVTSVSKEDKGQLSYFTDDVFDTYEERFYIYKGELKTVLQKFSNEAKSSQNIQGGHGTQSIQCGNGSGHVPISEIRLPHITIPCFSGDYTEWQSFHDLFTSLIHKNGSLDDVQKMHYLKVNLKGDAEVLLRQFPITGENYTQAWTILKKRYDNKRYIANCHFKKFFAQRTIVQEPATALKQLLDTSVESLNALKNLGLPTSQWDAIVIYIVVSKLDPGTHKHWEELINGEEPGDFPSFEKLKSFLETRFRTLEMVEPVNKSYKPPQPKTFHVTANDVECAFCKEKHFIHHCKQFAKRPVDERYDFVRDNNLCYNCLIPNHAVWRCKQKTSCQVCKRRHHSLLHRDSKQVEERQENKKADMTMEDSKVVAHVRPCGDGEERNILLATALVEVASNCGQPQVCRALIDQGSEASFVTARVVEFLSLKKTAISGAVSGISGHNNVCITNKVELQITSRYEPDFSVKVNAYVLKSLTSSLPAREINCNMWPQLDTTKLADPTFNTPSRVDILLGADVFGKIIDSGFMRGPGDVVAQYTHLGWILSGNTNTTSSRAHSITSFHVTRQVEEDNNLLKKLEEIVTKGYTNMKTCPREEELCDDYKDTTCRRDVTERYIDTLLSLKQSVENTVKSHGEIKQQTIGRFKQLEIKFYNNKSFNKKCTNATQKYIELGQMRQVEVEDEVAKVYHTQHAAIEDGDSTKMHMVVCTLTISSNSITLNNAWMNVPIIQSYLRSLTIYWKARSICVFEDVAKKYCQVWMTDKHTDLHRTVSKDGTPEKIENNKLRTVTSEVTGTAAAHYIAVRTLNEFAYNENHTYLSAASILKNSFYMDDLMTEYEDVSEIKKLSREINSLLKAGGFEMQKWLSYSEELLEFLRDMEVSEEPENIIEIQLDKVLTKLGLTWDRKDVINLPESRTPISKRQIISGVASLFDPFGWLAPVPVVITAKVMIQRLRLCSLGWDDELPPEIVEEWESYRDELNEHQRIQIPCWIGITIHRKDAQRDGFCPRVVDEKNPIHVIVLATKTKASLKQSTIPRLELCAMGLTTRLLHGMYHLLNISMNKVHVGMDSITLLSWLQLQPSQWPICARGGVLDITQHNIDNVNKRQRVQSAIDIASSNMWWTGFEQLKNKDGEFRGTTMPGVDRGLTQIFNNRLMDNSKQLSLSPTSRLKNILAFCLKCLRCTEKSNRQWFLNTTELEEIIQGMMRRGSMAILGGGEPLIVVEESGAEEEASYRSPVAARGLSIDQESPPDPYHLSPWRDTRKHSLPTPSCTTGPTASQVRRLSERGEGAAREAREAAFLATLSQVTPQTGGRRHSVVTISRVPQALFGRGRRESIAAFPALGRRRDSVKKCPPATETLGSTHNLQLDIMDDIVQARKVRMRLWNTSSERVCEVQPLDERSPMSGSVRYTNRGRRHSDFVGSPLPPIPARRRASEMPPPPPIPPRSGAGVICTDTDLHHMLNALTSSSTEIDLCGKPERVRRLVDTRSSSFDASTLRDKPPESGTTWFTRRHQTLATKKKINEPQKKSKVTFAPDSKQAPGDTAAVVWDQPSGSIVDASALGSAIEVFLRKSGAGEPGVSGSAATILKETGKSTGARPKVPEAPGGSRPSGRPGDERWCPTRPDDDEAAQGCDASLCSQLKDLFV